MSTCILTAANVDAAGYTVSYKAPSDSSFISVGTVEANEDFKLGFIKKLETFTASQFGEGTPVDGIYAGQSCLLTLVLNEINTDAALGLVHPESQVGGTPSVGGIPGYLGTPGAVASSLGGKLRLTPYFSSLPKFEPSNSANILELPCIWVEDGHEIQRQLAAGRHTIPLSIQVFPIIDEDDSNKLKFYTYESV